MKGTLLNQFSKDRKESSGIRSREKISSWQTQKSMTDTDTASLDRKDDPKKVMDTVNQWIKGAPGPQLSDSLLWSQPQYYSTIQTVSLDDQLYLLFRGKGGLSTCIYDPIGNQWENYDNISTIRDLGDVKGCDKPQYYRTIRSFVINSHLYLLARISTGIVLYFYDAGNRTWNKGPKGPELSDALLWDQPQYYSTIQSMAVDNRLYLLFRGKDGMRMSIYDPTSHQWDNEVSTLRDLDDVNGWNQRHYYSTIHPVVIKNVLYLRLVIPGELFYSPLNG